MSRLSRLPRVPVPVSAPDLGPALQRAGTPRGQLLGVTLIAVPAVTNALPLDGAGHTALQVVAVVVGTLGMVVVFGGLLQRTVLGRPGAEPATTSQNEPSEDDAEPEENSPFDSALLAVPHARTVWLFLALLSAVVLAGALWCLVLVFGHHPGTHLTDALMLALPGVVLGWATWRSRLMLSQPGQADQLSADPAFHLDQDTFQS